MIAEKNILDAMLSYFWISCTIAGIECFFGQKL